MREWEPLYVFGGSSGVIDPPRSPLMFTGVQSLSELRLGNVKLDPDERGRVIPTLRGKVCVWTRSFRLGGSGGAPSRGGTIGALGFWRIGDNSPVPLTEDSRFFTLGGKGGGLSTDEASDCKVVTVDIDANVDCDACENPLATDPTTEALVTFKMYTRLAINLKLKSFLKIYRLFCLLELK